MPRNKMYFKSKELGEMEQANSQSNLVSDTAMKYLSSLVDEEKEAGEQLIAGLESRKIVEAIVEGEKIDKIYSSILSPKSFVNNKGYTEPPKMADAYKKLASGFYKVFDDVITGKKQTGSELIKNVISLDKSMNQNITHYNTKNVTTFDRVMDSANQLMSDIRSGKEFGFFDIETIGGKNAHGFQELDEVTEFAYLGYTKNSRGEFKNTTKLSSVIGLIDDDYGTKYNSIKRELEGLKDTPKASWTEKQRIMVGSYSKYGHKNTSINPVTGSNEALWQVDFLESEGDGIGEIDTALKGLDLRKRIGDAQKRAAAANGGVYAYQQQYDEMIKRVASNEVSAGHNILKFDIPMLNRMAAVNGTQSIDTSSGSFFDMVAAMRYIGESKGKDFYYKDQLASVLAMRGFTVNQQEAITRYLYGEAGGEQHSAIKDTEQYASLFMNKTESGETFFEKIFSDLKEVQASNANKIQYRYAGANKQLFYVTNSEMFNSYNTKNALNMVMDPVSGQYRTFNGYAMDAEGKAVEKELFNQTGTMRNRTLSSFQIMKYDSTDELIKLLNPENKDDVTVPEMATGKGYVLAVTPYYDKEMAAKMGVAYDASMARKTLYFHDTYDSLLGQLTNAMPVANINDDGTLDPIAKNLRNEEMKLFNVINGQVSDVTPKTAGAHLNQLRRLNVERYTNEFAAEQARKLTLSKYKDISKAFIEGKSSRAEVMAGITKLSEMVAKGIPLTQEVQLLTTLGFVSNGSSKLYSETINKTANLAGYLYDQQPIFNEIISQINGLDYMQGDSKEAAANRDSAFATAYNALLEHLSTDPNAIKNGAPTTVVGASQLDYLNIRTSDIVGKDIKNVGESIVGAGDDYTRVYLNRGGGLVNALARAQNLPNTSVTNLKGSQGYALLSQFVQNMNKTAEYSGALNFTDDELKTFANTDASYFETAILGQLKDFTQRQRVANPSFGYSNESNMTQNVLTPNALIQRAFGADGKLLPGAKGVIENAVKNTPRSYKIYDNKTGINDLVEMLTNNMFSVSREDFEKSLQGLVAEDIQTGMYNFDLAHQAARNYATQIAKGIYNSDIQLAQGKNDMFLLREGKFATLNLPKFKNQNGLLYAQIDNTKNALFPYLNVNKAITKSGLDYSKIGYVSSFDKGIDYSLESSLRYAYQNGHDPFNAMLGWIKNTKQGIRETSPAFQSVNPRIFSEQYHQDITELINGMRYFNDNKIIQDLQRKGLLPNDFVSNLKNVLNHEDLYESFNELGSKEKMTFGTYKQIILHALSEHSEIRDPNVRRMLKMASDSAKDTDVAAGKIAVSTTINIGGGEFTNVGRPLVNQALDSVQYRKEILEQRLSKAGLSSQVAFGSVLSNSKSKFLTSVADKATGYEMVNTVSSKFLAMDQTSFNKMLITESEKAENAFDKAASKIAKGNERAGVAKKIFEKMKTLNLHEQELLISTKLSEAVHYKSQIQTVSSKKKMMVQFEKDLETQEAIETYSKLVPVLNKDGSISYKPGMKVKKGEKLFSVEGYNQVQKYGAKYDGVLQYGFYNQYDELIDSGTVNKLIASKKFTDIGQVEEYLEKNYDIESKYALMPKELQRSKLIVSGAEKGVTDFLYVGAGTLDESVKTMMLSKGLKGDIGVAYSDEYLRYLSSTNILSSKDIDAIYRERHLVGDALSNLLDTKNTGIQGVINQNITGHGNTNLMIESIVGHIKDAGKLDDDKVREHLNKAFDGVARVTSNGVEFTKSAYGMPIDINEINMAAKAAGLTFNVGGKTMYGKLFEKNGASGTVLYSSVMHDNDWGGGTSSSTDYQAIEEQIRNFQTKLEHRQSMLDYDAQNPHLSPEELADLQSQVKGYQQKIMALQDQQDVARNIEKGAVYSDRLDMTLNMRQYDEDTLKTIKSKLSPDEFKKYFGHAVTADGALSDDYKYKPFLQNWTDQIKETMMNRRETKEAIQQIGYGTMAMGYNADERLLNLDEMQKAGFKINGINDVDFAIAEQGRETLLSERNVYTNNMMLDLGQEFGDNRYLAISADSPRLTGNSLIKESRKEKLNAIKSAWDIYTTSDIAEDQSRARDRLLRAREEYIDLERKDITGKEGKMLDVLKMRLDNSHNGKVSMLAIIQGQEYDSVMASADKLSQLKRYNADILQTATFDGKSILQHYAEGKVLDVQFKSEKALRDMGYFDESFMRGVLNDNKTANIRTLEQQMKERLRTTGDVVLTQRFPIMKEGSGKPSLLYLDDALQGNQTKILAASAYGMKADVDGDTLLSSMMRDKKGNTYMHLMAAQERIAAGSKESVSGDLRALVRSQSAYMLDRAVNQNMALESDVQADLRKDARNAILDLNTVASDDIIGTKLYGALNGVTNITREQALEHVAASKTYVEIARQRLINNGETASGRTLHNTVLDVINEQHAGDATAIESLSRSYAISTRYNKLMTEETAKHLKGTTGEINLINKKMREAYYLTADRASEQFSMNTNILAHVLDQVEEAAISAKKATGTVDNARIEQWRTAINNVYNGTDVGENVNAMKSWLTENIPDKISGIAQKTRSTSNLYSEMTQEIASDSTKLSADYISRFADIVKSMAGNNGIKALNKGYFNFGEKVNGISAKQLMNMSVAENDNTIRGMAVRMLSEETQGRVGNILSSEDFVSDAVGQGFRERTYLADGREWLKDVPSTGQMARKVLKSTGEAFEKIAKGFDGKTLAMGALGLAGAFLVAGFVGGNPSRPAETQASEDSQYYDIPSLVQQNAQAAQASGGQQQGYVININAKTGKGTQHAIDTINQAVSRNYNNTNVNVSMNIVDDKGNINDRYVEQLLAGAVN